jgi:mRNA interferase MazF
MNYKQGQIVLADFPFTDLKRTKRRPAIIISGEEYNKGNDIILVAVTTQSKGFYETTLTQKDVEKGKILKESFIRCGKIVTLEKGQIAKELGKITPNKLKTVKQKLLKALQ